MEIFNSIFMWYLFVIVASFFATITRIYGNEWLKVFCIGIIVIFTNIFLNHLEYLQRLQNLIISLIVFLFCGYLLYLFFKKISYYFNKKHLH